MRRTSISLVLFPTAFFIFAIAPAFAGNAAKEIRDYSSLSVWFTKNAAQCGFESLEPFEQALRHDLSAVGVNLDGRSVVSSELEIRGILHGAQNVHCTIEVNLSFRTTLAAANIVTDNPDVQQLIDKLGSFHVPLYKGNAVAVSPVLHTVADGRNDPSGTAHVIKVIHELVARFDEARSH